MIQKKILAGAAAVALIGGAAAAQPMGSAMGPMPPMDHGAMTPGGAMPTPAYVAAAAKSDKFEIAEAKMALHHSTNPHIQQFARMMITDHTKSTQMIKMALTRSGRPIPPPPMLGPEQEQMMADLRAAGPNFDKVYIDQQVQAHEKALAVHQGYASGGDNPELRRAAGMIVPVVQHHLSMAQDIQSHIG